MAETNIYYQRLVVRYLCMAETNIYYQRLVVRYFCMADEYILSGASG